MLSKHNEAQMPPSLHKTIKPQLCVRYSFAAPTRQRLIELPSLDALLIAADTALRTLSGANYATRPCPSVVGDAPTLNDAQRRLSGALMRVNHVGEICAQALYSAQSLNTHNSHLKRQLEHAAREETDHLAWTQQRLSELNARPSLLNAFWYAGAFGCGLLAGRMGDSVSLGFVVETEHQVEAHLASHLEQLPSNDLASRAIVRQMKDDEVEHAARAEAAGAVQLPAPVRRAMRGAAKVMTTTAHYI